MSLPPRIENPLIHDLEGDTFTNRIAIPLSRIKYSIKT